MDNAFDRMNIGLRERPLSADINRLQSQQDRTVRELMRAIFAGRASNTSAANASRNGFIGDGLRVVPVSPAAMQVQVSAGFGFIYDAVDVPANIGSTDLEGVDDRSPYKPVFLSTAHVFNVPAAPAGPNTRIDIIEVKVDRRLENSLTRRALDPGTKAFVDKSFFKTLAFGLDGRTGQVTEPASSAAGLSYKIGVAGNPGTVPATTAGYVKLAEILVGSGVATITMAAGSGGAIVDRRPLLGPGGVIVGSVSWRQRWNAGAPIVDILDVCGPPGIDIGVAFENGSGAHNSGTLYVIGGELTQATVTVTAHECSTAFQNAIGNLGIPGGGVAGVVSTIAGGDNTQLVAAGLSAAIGQKAVEANYTAIANSGGSVSSNLDDLIWHAQFQLAYHA